MPSDAPSNAPSDYPSSVPSSAPTSNFLSACRCDGLGNCLSQALAPSAPLTLCVFANAERFQVASIESLELVQGSLEQQVLATGDGNATGLLRRCGASFCAVEVQVSTGFFDSASVSVLSARGVALLTSVGHSRRILRGSTNDGVPAPQALHLEFSADVALGRSESAVGGEPETPSVGDDGKPGPNLKAILIPLFVVVGLLAIGGLAYWTRRRRQQQLRNGDLSQ